LSVFLTAPLGLALVTHQPLHSASLGAVVCFNPHVWLLSDWPWGAVPSLAFVVISLVLLAGHFVGPTGGRWQRHP
jgi:hypothetical protein